MIRAARAAQNSAARVVTRHGLAHPVTLVLLTAAATAWGTGHAVNEPPVPAEWLCSAAMADDLYTRQQHRR
ncbi:hypothetical protein ABT218_19955 [Streptomyces sp. NPDC001455]|uniref:hypothetical protein n=1 Tax=Streptomyces sp. NPDC001455 TaxID=3154518 RepID=UPI003328DC12